MNRKLLANCGTSIYADFCTKICFCDIIYVINCKCYTNQWNQFGTELRCSAYLLAVANYLCKQQFSALKTNLIKITLSQIIDDVCDHGPTQISRMKWLYRTLNLLWHCSEISDLADFLYLRSLISAKVISAFCRTMSFWKSVEVQNQRLSPHASMAYLKIILTGFPVSSLPCQ